MSMPSICRSPGTVATAGLHQRGEEVDLVHELVADPAGGHLPGPADQARRPVGALQRGEQPAPPRPGEPVPLAARRIRVDRREAVGGVGAVVGGPHHDGVLGDAQLVELVEDRAGEVVHLGENVGPVPPLGLARVLRVRDRRDVDLRVGQVDVEGLARLLGAGHEVAGPLGDLAVESGPELGVVGRRRPRTSRPSSASRSAPVPAGSASAPHTGRRSPRHPGSRTASSTAPHRRCAGTTPPRRTRSPPGCAARGRCPGATCPTSPSRTRRRTAPGRSSPPTGSSRPARR